MSKDKRVKDLSGMGQLIMDINSRRCDSEVYINQKIDVTELCKYVEKKKKDNDGITFFHAFVTALGKIIYNRPKLNYYVRNRHIYERSEICISFSAKVNFNDSSEELMLMVPFKESDTIDSLSQYVKSVVEKIRKKKEDRLVTKSKKGANSAIDIVGKFPNIIRVPIVGVLKYMDKKGILPAGLKEDNLYYSTMIVSNIGSLHSDAIYHHLSHFGTCSAITTIGEIKDEVVLINGKEKRRKICEFGITLDERIADGYYFIKSIQLFQQFMNNPDLLDEPVGTKYDVDSMTKI